MLFAQVVQCAGTISPLGPDFGQVLSAKGLIYWNGDSGRGIGGGIGAPADPVLVGEPLLDKVAVQLLDICVESPVFSVQGQAYIIAFQTGHKIPAQPGIEDLLHK